MLKDRPILKAQYVKNPATPFIYQRGAGFLNEHSSYTIAVLLLLGSSDYRGPSIFPNR